MIKIIYPKLIKLFVINLFTLFIIFFTFRTIITEKITTEQDLLRIGYSCIVETSEYDNKGSVLFKIDFPYYLLSNGEKIPVNLFMTSSDDSKNPFFLNNLKLPVVSKNLELDSITMRSNLEEFEIEYENLTNLNISKFYGLDYYEDFVILPYTSSIKDENLSNLVYFFGYSNNSCDDIKLKTVINFANLDAIFHSNRSTLNLLIFIRSVIIIFIASVFLKLYIQFYTLFSKIYLKVNLRKERNMLLFFIPFILLNFFFIFIWKELLNV